MFQFSFLSLFTRTLSTTTSPRIYPRALTDSTVPPTTGTGLNNNVSLEIGGNDLINSGGNTAGIIILYFVIILALVAALFFVRKFLLKRIKGFNHGRRMRVSDRIMISQDKQIMMVELAGKMMIVGVTNHAISQLALLEKDDCAEFIEDETLSFGNILSDKIGALRRQSGIKNDLPDENEKDE